MTERTNRTSVASDRTWARLGVALAPICSLVLGCGGESPEPGVKAIVELAPFMENHKGDCMTVAHDFGEEANKKGKELLTLPSRYAKDFADRLKVVKEKFGSQLGEPCKKIIASSDKCRVDGAANLTGNGQTIIDVCKGLQ